MINTNKNTKSQKDCFWAIRSTVKAFFVRGVELIVLIFFTTISYVNFHKSNFLFDLIIGILIATSISFILYKSYRTLATKSRKRKEILIEFFKEIFSYLREEWGSYFTSELKNFFYKLLLFVKKLKKILSYVRSFTHSTD